MDTALKRKKYIIDPTFQLKFISKFCLVVLIAFILIGGVVFMLTRNSTTIAIEDTKIMVKDTSDFILPILSLTLVMVIVATALTVLILTLFVSHKIVGPIYRVQREIDLMKDGDLTRSFNIREKDQLQGLANSLSLMTNKLRSRHLELRNACQSLFYFLEERGFSLQPADRDGIQPLIEEVRRQLEYFKV